MERASAPRLKRFVSQQALRILRAQKASARVSTFLWVTPKLVKYFKFPYPGSIKGYRMVPDKLGVYRHGANVNIVVIVNLDDLNVSQF